MQTIKRQWKLLLILFVDIKKELLCIQGNYWEKKCCLTSQGRINHVQDNVFRWIHENKFILSTHQSIANNYDPLLQLIG